MCGGWFVPFRHFVAKAKRRKIASFRLRPEITKRRKIASFRLRHEITKRRKKDAILRLFVISWRIRKAQFWVFSHSPRNNEMAQISHHIIMTPEICISISVVDLAHCQIKIRVCETLCPRGMSVFFSGYMGNESYIARDKQIAWTAKRFSGDLFVPRYDYSPWTQKKDTHSLYLQFFQQRLSLKFPEKGYEFKIPIVTCTWLHLMY